MGKYKETNKNQAFMSSEFQKDRNNVVKKIIANMFQFAKTQSYIFKPSSEPPNGTNSEKVMLTHIRIKLLKSKHKNNFFSPTQSHKPKQDSPSVPYIGG